MTIQADQPKKTKYAHLSHQDRNLIQEELDRGSSMKTIADLLGKDPSTIEYSAKSEPLGCSISSEWVALSTRYIQVILYDFSIQQMQRRLERQTDYEYDRITGEYRHREVPMSPPEKFLRLDNLERSRKPVQIPDTASTDLDFDKLIVVLLYDRGLELSCISGLIMAPRP